MDPKDIETDAHLTEADATRARIAATLDDLSDRLNPRNLVSKAMNDMQHRSTEALDGATRIVRENPVAISIIGLSIGLLMLGKNLKSRDYDAYGDVYGDDDLPERESRVHRSWTAVRERADDARERAGELRATAAERAAHAREAATERWEDLKETSAEYAARAKARAAEARQRASDSFDENPLAGALLGLAAGVALGALLPRTRQEDELLGETRDRLAERAKDAAKAATDAGKAQLDQLGVSVDAARAKLGEFGEQAKVIAKNAATAASEQLKA